MIPPNFIIGVWAQPASSVAKWRDRGVNTFYGYDGGGNVSKADWERIVAAGGMSFIDQPGADVAAEAKQPGRIGFAQPDESDLVSHVNLAGSMIGDLKATYLRCQPTGVPVFQNLAGSAFDNIYYDGTPHPAKTDASKWGHRAATGGYMAWADVIGFDYHLWTTGRPGMFDITRRLMDRANDWSGGKPIFAYVELNTQGTGKPFTADDYESEVSVIVGYAKEKGYNLHGIIYFAHTVYPTFKNYDGTADDVVARMKIVNARLAAPVTPPPDPVAALTAQVSQLTADLATARAETAAVKADVSAIGDWIRKAPAASQPSK